MNLLHISFRDNLPEVLIPRQPDGCDIGSVNVESMYAENLPPRVSFAPTLEGCFYGVYPNVSKYFEVEKYPHLEYFVYRALTDDETTYTDASTIWDQHVTGEVCITSPIKVELVAKIQVINTTNNGAHDVYAYPFNDMKRKPEFVGPKFQYKVIDLYKPIELT